MCRAVWIRDNNDDAFDEFEVEAEEEEVEEFTGGDLIDKGNSNDDSGGDIWEARDE